MQFFDLGISLKKKIIKDFDGIVKQKDFILNLFDFIILS
ncbi:hypothetical protein LMANV2_30017 [Leptospira interrogans serovar Manilae]|uniref:Uncharacterized protein n=1 Tax=Leptospira interrogans serovar Manilae TaxID=214675 RepID=A0AAQ1SNK3_LEPIR|nr:hypothetical protein LMANV2_30017 [Leptospira interrogans serovar Manilae]